jgi:hypothetical protein
MKLKLKSKIKPMDFKVINLLKTGWLVQTDRHLDTHE